MHVTNQLLSTFRCIHPSAPFTQPQMSSQIPILPTPPSSLPMSSPNDALQDSNVPLSSYTFVDIPAENLPVSGIPPPMCGLACTVIHCLNHLQTKCEVCYFLGWHCPILVVETHPWGGKWESYDYHKNEAEHCPWHLLHLSTPYASFSSKVHTLLCHSDSGGEGWTVCTHCGEPSDVTEYYKQYCYGQSLFMLAFLIWDDCSTRDHVFSFICTHTHTNIPAFPSRQEYAEWLRSPIFSAQPTLNHLHLVIVAYDILRHACLLFRWAFHLLIGLHWLIYNHPAWNFLSLRTLWSTEQKGCYRCMPPFILYILLSFWHFELPFLIGFYYNPSSSSSNSL